MMSKAANVPPSPSLIVAWLRLLVLLPLFLLRDSSARTTWPSPLELENTIARIAHPAAFIPDDVDGLVSVSFFDPATVSAATKRGWQWTPDSRAISAVPAVPAASSNSATLTALTALTAIHPANPPPHPALTPVRPARTLAALQHAPVLPASPATGVQHTQHTQHAQLAAHWRHSPQLRDRFLASLWGNPAPTMPHDPAASTAPTFRRSSLGDPTAHAALDARLSFNPLTVVSSQLRGFANAPALTTEFAPDPTTRREYNFVGCRLPGRAAELRFGLMDLTEKQFRLNPGNVCSEESRERTAMVSARFKF